MQIIKTSLWIGSSIFAVLGSAALASAASPPVVYHSPTMDGMNPGVPYTLSVPSETLDLWFSPGAALSNTGGGEEICLDGSGDEVCGLTVVIEATGDISFDLFDEDVPNDIVAHLASSSLLKISRINGINGGDNGPIRLGALHISAGPIPGEITLGVESEAIGASLQKLIVASNDPIAMPEPGLVIAIGVGSAALAVAGRSRRPRDERS